MSRYDFGSNVWEENKTYVPFKYDCSDLYDVLETFINNYNEDIINNMRETYLTEYHPNKLCERWYNIFNQLSSVDYE